MNTLWPLCLNTSTIKPAPLDEKIRVAAAAGYSAIEPWNVEVDDYLAAGGTLAELRQTIDDTGLRVASMIAMMGWADAEEGPPYRTAIDEARRRLDQAAALGSPYLVASPPPGPVDIHKVGDRLAELNDLGRAVGVRPAMEFLGFVGGVHTLATALAIADASGDPTAPIVADVFHLLRGGGSIDDLLTLPGDRLAIFHINDLPADPPFADQSDSDRVLPGDGVADLPLVLAHLRSIGYTGPLSLELFNAPLWAADPLSVALAGAHRLRALMAAEG